MAIQPSDLGRWQRAAAERHCDAGRPDHRGVLSRAQAIVFAFQEDAPAPTVLADVTRLEDIKRREEMSG